MLTDFQNCSEIIDSTPDILYTLQGRKIPPSKNVLFYGDPGTHVMHGSY